MASTAPQDNGGSLRKSIGLIELFTFWTCEPIRPAQAFQIGSAGGIIGKNPLKIGKRCWKAAGVHSGKLSPIHRIGNKPDRQGSDNVRNPRNRERFLGLFSQPRGLRWAFCQTHSGSQLGRLFHSLHTVSGRLLHIPHAVFRLPILPSSMSC